MKHSATGAPPAPVPTRAADLEMLGESKGSGYVDRTFLVRRGDGQVVQLSELLYVTLEHLDGRADEQVGEGVTARVGRELDVDGVLFLVEHKLAPLGLVASDGGPGVPPPAAEEAVLTLAGRRTVVRARTVNAMARALRPFFWQVTVVLVLEAVVLGDWWAFSRHDVGAAITAVLTTPTQLLAVLALMVASMLFHEVGHATGARYGGARPGVIGMGLYVVWPAFYTDVTDAYRLDRAGRLRTDLGGVYFNLVFLLGLLGMHEWTGAPVFLVAAVLTHLEILQQLMPIVRLDGYFIVGDLVGVPDLFRWVRPILRSMLPGAGRHAQVRRLRGWVRWVVTVWVVLVVPVLAVNVWVLASTGPDLLATTTSTLRVSSHELSAQLHTWQVVPAVVTALSMVALMLPLLGIWVLVTRLGGKVRRQVAAFAARGRVHRVAVTLGVTVTALVMAYTWLPEPVPVATTPAAVAAPAPTATSAAPAPAVTPDVDPTPSRSTPPAKKRKPKRSATANAGTPAPAAVATSGTGTPRPSQGSATTSGSPTSSPSPKPSKRSSSPTASKEPTPSPSESGSASASSDPSATSPAPDPTTPQPHPTTPPPSPSP
jgi:putative peptide zinc metalloprotease protein